MIKKETIVREKKRLRVKRERNVGRVKREKSENLRKWKMKEERLNVWKK